MPDAPQEELSVPVIASPVDHDTSSVKEEHSSELEKETDTRLEALLTVAFLVAQRDFGKGGGRGF